MKSNFFALAAVALGTASMVVLEATSVQAATVTQSFFIDVTTGTFAGQTFGGSFSYDDTTTIVNNLLTPVNNDLTLQFNLGGQSFTETDDGDFPSFPAVSLDNTGLFAGLSFLVETNDAFINAGDATGPNNTFAFEFGPVGALTASGEGVLRPVPTPALLPGLIGLGFGVLRKRHSEQSEATE